jgi:hypothetical protein
MKTALQEVFSKLETEYPSLFNTHSVDGRNFINNYYKFLELEKQQIIDAHGNQTKKSGGVTNHTYILTGEKYYNETFKTN